MIDTRSNTVSNTRSNTELIPVSNTRSNTVSNTNKEQPRSYLVAIR